MNLDRREEDRGQVDRRKSERWKLERALRWRVYRGRRTREALIVERSLNGLALWIRDRDVVAAGSRIVVAGTRREIERLGFRSVLVRRTDPSKNGGEMVFAEIEV